MPRKVFDSNKPILLKLLLGEIVSVTGASQVAQGLVWAYNSGNTQAQKEARFYNVLTFGPVGAFLGMDEDELKKEVDAEFGSTANLVNMISDFSTLGFQPRSNHVYVLKDNTLGTLPGEYRIGEVVNVDGVAYGVERKSNLSGYVDWMFGVPNFSWVGAFEEVNTPSQTALEAALTPEEYAAFQQSGGNRGRGAGSSSKKGIPWWAWFVGLLVLVRR